MSVSCHYHYTLLFPFFFQPEDGIPYRNVTEVQTCALPVSLRSPARRASERQARPPVFVPHPRIELAARKLGVREIVVTGRGDARTVAEMAAFFAKV